jgi:hypothetical protein
MKLAPLLLLALLALASFGFPAMAPQQSSPAHAWRESPKADNARGTAYNRFTLTGKFLRAPQHGGDVANRPALVVDCRPGKESRNGKGKFEEASLLVGTTLKIDYVEPQEIHGTSYYPKVSVHYRINDTKDEDEKWPPGADKTSAAVPKEWLKKILRAQAVDVTLNDDSGSPIVIKFDMPDPKPLEEGCNVDE